jgi:hypothetical protein
MAKGVLHTQRESSNGRSVFPSQFQLLVPFGSCVSTSQFLIAILNIVPLSGAQVQCFPHDLVSSEKLFAAVRIYNFTTDLLKLEADFL